MVVYECLLCDFHTILKANYNAHLKTSKHKNNEAKCKSKCKSDVSLTDFACKYCDKTFKHRQSVSKHIKYSCEKNKDEDLQELARLLNIQMEQQKKLENKVIELEKENDQIKKENAQIKKLENKLQINGGVHIQNIQLNSYRDTDISHLTDMDYANCIKQVNHCVKRLIEKIHYNKSKPENMNIYISNLKNKYLMVYQDGNWNIMTKREIDYLYDEKETMLEDWLEENPNPELKTKFVKYLNNKEKDDNLNMIKEEIKLMMYNKKFLIEN